MSDAELAEAVARGLAGRIEHGQRVLLVLPDNTRKAPIGRVFRALTAELRRRVARIEVLFALGTHAAMSRADMLRRLDMSEREWQDAYADLELHNHEWDRADALADLGELTEAETAELSEGRLAVRVPVRINRRVLETDHVVLLGPVLPHEVVGFSGGAKYLFPGVSGAEILNFFHWLGALITNRRIIGVAETPVRRVIHRAARLVPTPVTAVCLVTSEHGLAEVWIEEPERAWENAVPGSARHYIRRVERPFRAVLSEAPRMYTDLWVGGKCMYKLEPVVQDGGELTIYAPHIREVSHTHGARMEALGYHVRDYFLHHWERYRNVPWGLLAHSTHVRGDGRYVDGREEPRIRVTLATGIDEDTCRRIGLGYCDPATIDPSSFEGVEGRLRVREAGETLYRLTSDSP
jgi:nickel-dependent lactate racemase